ncbi:hypothetical protein F4825DRAFT_335653 [Nemania diffusa]|nr:hypothetical protein F4825DRAFT_335653 [Nemania diffusa]
MSAPCQEHQIMCVSDKVSIAVLVLLIARVSSFSIPTFIIDMRLGTYIHGEWYPTYQLLYHMPTPPIINQMTM